LSNFDFVAREEVKERFPRARDSELNATHELELGLWVINEGFDNINYRS
jgi:hypothetical protein